MEIITDYQWLFDLIVIVTLFILVVWNVVHGNTINDLENRTTTLGYQFDSIFNSMTTKGNSLPDKEQERLPKTTASAKKSKEQKQKPTTKYFKGDILSGCDRIITLKKYDGKYWEDTEGACWSEDYLDKHFVSAEAKEEKVQELIDRPTKEKIITIPSEALGRKLVDEIENCKDGKLKALLIYYWSKVKCKTIVDVIYSNYSPYNRKGTGEGTIQKFRDTYNCPDWHRIK